VFFARGAGAIDTPAYRGDALEAGRRIDGPAVVDLAITGIVVPPGSSCERRETGDFVLRIH
jgi:N-methylhydantoinase A/oxoprolinase/acetone carboxylase beta subunit